MKAVLISIQPKWVELIASGNKTIEVRKTRPKLETPFKCYIYCTIGNGAKGDYLVPSGIQCGKVIGEFVCDRITALYNVATTSWDLLYGNVHDYAKSLVRKARLTEEEMHDYAKGKNCFAWHISDLKIYDKPKELGEFYSVAESGSDCCVGCVYHETPLEKLPCKSCTGERKYLYRSPQSWQYVEELGE
jgi:predicted transcriptional regulator